METGNGTRDCDDMSIPAISTRLPAEKREMAIKRGFPLIDCSSYLDH